MSSPAEYRTKQKCLEAANKIQNASARSTAENACDQITTSNANVSTALNKANTAAVAIAFGAQKLDVAVTSEVVAPRAAAMAIARAALDLILQ